MVPPWLNTYMNSRSLIEANPPLVNCSRARHSPASSAAAMPLAAGGFGCGRPATPSRTICASNTVDVVRIGSLSHCNVSRRVSGGIAHDLPNGADVPAEIGFAPRLLQRQNPLDNGVQVPVGHLRIWRHRNRAPDARSAILHLVDERGLRILAPVLRGDIVEGRPDNLVVHRVTRGAAVLRRHPVRRH